MIHHNNILNILDIARARVVEAEGGAGEAKAAQGGLEPQSLEPTPPYRGPCLETGKEGKVVHSPIARLNQRIENFRKASDGGARNPCLLTLFNPKGCRGVALGGLVYG